MSALGQKRTFALQNGMSALPPKADMCSAPVYVRFGPIADIASCHSITSCEPTKISVSCETRQLQLCAGVAPIISQAELSRSDDINPMLDGLT